MIPTLYKRNSAGIPIMWKIEPYNGLISISHGIVNKTCTHEIIRPTMKTLEAEITSRYNAKRKEGYKTFQEIKDSAPEGVDGSYIYNYLNAYLPKYNVTDEGLILPMLAKTLEDNKPFDKFGYMLGQYKINGVRCIVGVNKNEGDLFKPYNVTYQSREGTKWNLPDFDDYILNAIPDELLAMMVEEGVHLDGELYIPGLTVNEINSAVKNTASPWHHNLQYWIYDICAEDIISSNRKNLLYKYFESYILEVYNKEVHYTNEYKIVVLPSFNIENFESAINIRNKFIDFGFEGLILRNPNAEYMFGKRSVNGMYKFKKKDDGKFKIISIISDKRNLPIFILKNDINDEEFEVTFNASQDVQQAMLGNKLDYIGRYMFVEFRERSGVRQVPFHAKGIKIV